MKTLWIFSLKLSYCNGFIYIDEISCEIGAMHKEIKNLNKNDKYMMLFQSIETN